MTDHSHDWIAMADELNHHRGAYLGQMCVMDVLLETALLVFFEIPFARKQQLARGSILEKLGFSDKVDTPHYILVATGLDDEDNKTFLSELRAANTYRNLLAHAAIGPRLGEGSDVLVITAMRFRKERPQNEDISPRSIETHVKRLDGLSPSFVRVIKALNALPSGDAGVPAF